MNLRWQVDDETLDRCIAIALTQKRFMRASLKQTLYQKQIYADMHQELAAAAVEAWRLGYDPDRDFRLIKNLTQRRIYAFLKANAIHRHWDPRTKKQGKGFFSREVCFPVDESESVEFGDNVELIAWCQHYVVEHLGKTAWQKLKAWADSKSPAPQGKAAEAISMLKEVFL